jgi:MipA family protein
MQTRRVLTHLALLSCCIAAPTLAAAQAMDFVRLAPPGGTGLRLSVGLGAAAVPEFSGASERRAQVLPLVDAQWANGLFASTRNGLGYNFSRDPSFHAGLRVSLDLGRDSKRSPRLDGFDDIDPSAMFGAFANWRVGGSWSLLGSVQTGAGGEGRAANAQLGLGYGTALGPRVQLGATASVMVATSEYMQLFHGVSAGQSARGGLPVYTPTGGLHSARLAVNANYALDARWSLGAFASGARLLRDAADSPITQDRNQASVGVLVSYRFE